MSISLSVCDCGDDSPEALTRLGAPTPDHQNVVSGIDVDIVAAVAQRPERVRRRALPLSLLCIEPPEEAVIGTVCAWRRRHLHIRGRNDLTIGPLAASQPEQSKSRHV